MTAERQGKGRTQHSNSLLISELIIFNVIRMYKIEIQEHVTSAYGIYTFKKNHTHTHIHTRTHTHTHIWEERETHTH